MDTEFIVCTNSYGSIHLDKKNWYSKIVSILHATIAKENILVADMTAKENILVADVIAKENILVADVIAQNTPPQK